MPQDPTPVRRCVCADVTFEELKLADVTSLEDAAERFDVGIQCGTCRPYVELMIETGKTAFPVL
jgi:bacterioferritin-associated ferredoxin